MAGMFGTTGEIVIGKVNDGPMPGFFDVVINRSSVFGNKFHIGEDGTRKEVCTKYEKWAVKRMTKSCLFTRRINELRKRHRAGENIRLLCHCTPKQCHGQTVAKLIRGNI